MLKKLVKFTSQLTKADPAATQEFHFILPHLFMLHLLNPTIPYHHWASQCSAFILPLHYPKVGSAILISGNGKEIAVCKLKNFTKNVSPLKCKEQGDNMENTDL